jgi:hypothetical protein
MVSMARNVNVRKIAQRTPSCPRCLSKRTRLNGFIGGSQRYKCLTCRYNFLLVNSRRSPEFLDEILYLISAAEVRRILPGGADIGMEKYEKIDEMASILFENRRYIERQLSNESLRQHGIRGLNRIFYQEDQDRNVKYFVMQFENYNVYLLSRER